MVQKEKHHPTKRTIDPPLWVTQAWDFLHAVTIAYPEKDPTDSQKREMKLFFESLGPVLPCVSCSKHFASMLESNPIQLQNRESLSKWLVMVHNKVNVRLHKPEMSYDYVKKKYDDMFNQDANCQCDVSAEACQLVANKTKQFNQEKLQEGLMWSAIALLIVFIIMAGILLYFHYKS